MHRCTQHANALQLLHCVYGHQQSQALRRNSNVAVVKVMHTTVQAGHVEVDAPVGFVFQNPDHQVVMPTVAADVAFGLGRRVLTGAQVYRTFGLPLLAILSAEMPPPPCTCSAASHVRPGPASTSTPRL